eukprot:360150-Pelagomonas_calceolata.AAC.15
MSTDENLRLCALCTNEHVFDVCESQCVREGGLAPAQAAAAGRGACAHHTASYKEEACAMFAELTLLSYWVGPESGFVFHGMCHYKSMLEPATLRASLRLSRAQ